MERAIFLSGRVMMDDGTPPPEPVTIERLCNGMARPEAYTDSKGRFSFQLGQNQRAMMPDASVASDGFGGASSGASGIAGGSRGGQGMGGDTRTMGCELRASLPGYRSDIVNLGNRRSLDNPDVGVIVLHRLGNVEGNTISATSFQAPKDARKAFEKGADLMKKKKWPEAEKQLLKAVEIYPNYASAWYELGMAYQQQDSVDQARKAYGQALSADPKYVKPYLQIATLAVKDKNWQGVAAATSQLIRLDPVDFPAAYFYDSVANFNLRNLDAAEKSAREAVRLDSGHRMPKAEHVLGVILANKQDYAGAAQFMKSYLEHAPDAEDADVVRKQLVQIEKFAAAQSPQQ